MNDVAQKVINFRQQYEQCATNTNKENCRKNYIAKYLATFNKPEKNTKEHTDNIIRYMRITKYIYIRGKYGSTCIDLEPRRMVEINSILENDDGSAKDFSKEEWIRYYGTYGAYDLPFDAVKNLLKFLMKI